MSAKAALSSESRFLEGVKAEFYSSLRAGKGFLLQNS